jgi:hypothetical protein
VTRPPFEVADIIRRYGTRFSETHRAWLTAQHLRVLRAIERCRTAALGGHLDRCSVCGHRAISFNSCRNRHCPKCLTHARDQWLAERERELLPVGYAHVVFTLPHALSGLALQNKPVIYDLLFHASAATLLEVARTPKHLGAALGFLSVLHTWGQTLLHHPHVHCVVPAGGLSRDGTRWVQAQPAFFLPVKVLSRVFRGKFVAGLRAAFRAGRLTMPRDLQHLKTEPAFAAWLRTLFRHQWVVYAKPPLRRPEPCPPLSGPVHASGCDLESPTRRGHRRSGDVSVEGLSPRESGPTDDAQRRGIPPPLLPPRATEGFRADSLLWLLGTSLSHRGTATLPPGARGESTGGGGGLRRRPVHPRLLAAVSSLRWGDGRRRTTHRPPTHRAGLDQGTRA